MKIESFNEVRELLGEPNKNLDKKIYPHLNSRMVAFIQRSPLLFISTVDEEGYPTISPKGDEPGFTLVENVSTLYIPERKGNKLAFSFKNILKGSKVALLFVVPGTNEVLRVHGKGSLINDGELNKRLSSKSQNAILVTKLDVVSCYFHCGKAFLRSKLFSDDLQMIDMKISFGLELSDNGGLDKSESQLFDEGVKSRYKTDL